MRTPIAPLDPLDAARVRASRVRVRVRVGVGVGVRVSSPSARLAVSTRTLQHHSERRAPWREYIR